jgi:hypothetical protein
MSTGTDDSCCEKRGKEELFYVDLFECSELEKKFCKRFRLGVVHTVYLGLDWLFSKMGLNFKMYG